MSSGLQRLSFDTSGVNALADSPDCAALLAGISSGYFTRLTFPSVAEPLATTNEARRNRLFDTLNALRLNGECLEAHQWILTQLVQNNEKHGRGMWDSLALRFAECEVEIARRELCRPYTQKVTLRRLVLAKCACRVNPQDSRAGDRTCDCRDCKHEDGRTCERHRINSRNAEQKAACQFLRAPCAKESYGRTNHGHFQTFV